MAEEPNEPGSWRAYPMLLAAWLVATLAGLWALQPPATPADGEPGRPGPLETRVTARLAPDWQNVPRPSDPLEMRYHSHDPVGYRLEARWEEEGDHGEVGGAMMLDVRSSWMRQESVAGLGLGVEIEQARLEVRGDGEPVLSFRAAQEQAALQGAVYQREHDEMGAGGRSEWGRSSGEAGAGSLALIDDLQRLLTPRFPLEPTLVGERWRYRIDTMALVEVPRGGATQPPLEAEVQVEDRLRDFIMYQGRPTLWIARQVRAELREVRDGPAGRSLHVKGQGEGTLLWDLARAELVASEVEMSFTLNRQSGRRSLQARLEQIAASPQNALPSLPSAY